MAEGEAGKRTAADAGTATTNTSDAPTSVEVFTIDDAIFHDANIWARLRETSMAWRPSCAGALLPRQLCSLPSAATGGMIALPFTDVETGVP